MKMNEKWTFVFFFLLIIIIIRIGFGFVSSFSSGWFRSHVLCELKVLMMVSFFKQETFEWISEEMVGMWRKIYIYNIMKKKMIDRRIRVWWGSLAYFWFCGFHKFSWPLLSYTLSLSLTRYMWWPFLLLWPSYKLARETTTKYYHLSFFAFKSVGFYWLSVYNSYFKYFTDRLVSLIHLENICDAHFKTLIDWLSRNFCFEMNMPSLKIF